MLFSFKSMHSAGKTRYSPRKVRAPGFLHPKGDLASERAHLPGTNGVIEGKCKEIGLHREPAQFLCSSKRPANLSVLIHSCILPLPSVSSSIRRGSRSAPLCSLCLLTGAARIHGGLNVVFLYILANSLTWKAFVTAL